MESNQNIKQIIKSELPRIMETDPEIHDFILRLTRKQYADRNKTDDRIERLFEELKRDREISEKRWEENQKKWEENQKEIREMIKSISKLSQKHDSSIGALGARWGLQSEASFRNGLKAILTESFEVRVERYEDFDHEGMVFGRPEQIELDVIISNGAVILCEIKSSISKAEMHVFYRKKEYYEQKHGLRVNRTMVISPMIEPLALKVAGELGIETCSYADGVTL